MNRIEALVRIRAGVLGIKHQQLVQQRRTAAPVAQHKQRRLLRLRAPNVVTEQQPLKHVAKTIERRVDRNRKRQRHAARRHSKMIAH
jgi:hypothetical protein